MPHTNSDDACDPANTVPYRVVEGDTLFKISREKNVPMECLLKLNNLTNKDMLPVGQVLLLPA
jgi:peptidoglycan DL-endopeptidase LytE